MAQPDAEQIAARIREAHAQNAGGDVEAVIAELVAEGAPEPVVREIAALSLGEADEAEAQGGRV